MEVNYFGLLRLAQAFGSHCLIGAGTVMSAAQVDEVAAKAWEHAEKMRDWPKKKVPDLPSAA